MIAFRGIVRCLLGLSLAAAGCGPLTAGALPDQVECAGVRLIRVPRGERKIGTDFSRAFSWERPACLFRLNYDLYMGQTEVTIAQFRSVMGYCHILGDPNKPVFCTWEEADEFCKRVGARLREQTGRDWVCRLPREAEWEYAARYGRPTREDWWPIGGRPSRDGYDLTKHAWYRDTADQGSRPVAQKAPNPLGLYDMLGNRLEWCDGWMTDSVEEMLRDGWKPDYAGAHRRGGARVRTTRGGDWVADEDECRPSARFGWFTGTGSREGFRVVALPGADCVGGDR